MGSVWLGIRLMVRFFKKKKQAPEITQGLVLDYMLNSFKVAENPVQVLPWNKDLTGSDAYCVLKRLNKIEIESCGNFSLINTEQDKILESEHKTRTYDEMSNYIIMQHNILKLAMVAPTYDQVMEIILKDSSVSTAEIEKELGEIQELFKKVKDSKKPGDIKQADELRERYAMYEIMFRYPFPFDFVANAQAYALSQDVSQINMVTEEILYKYYIESSRANNAPADHADGVFTEFNKADINNRAWLIGDKKQAEKKQTQPKINL